MPRQIVSKPIRTAQLLIGYLESETSKDFSGYKKWLIENCPSKNSPPQNWVDTLSLINHILTNSNLYKFTDKFPQVSGFVSYIIKIFTEEISSKKSADQNLLIAKCINALSNIYKKSALEALDLVKLLNGWSSENAILADRKQSRSKINPEKLDVVNLVSMVNAQYKKTDDVRLLSSLIASLGSAAKLGIVLSGKIPTRNILEKFCGNLTDVTAESISQIFSGLNKLAEKEHALKIKKPKIIINPGHINALLKRLTAKGVKKDKKIILSCIKSLYGLLKKNAIDPLTLNLLDMDLVQKMYSQFIKVTPLPNNNDFTAMTSHVSLIGKSLKRTGKIEFQSILNSLGLCLEYNKKDLESGKSADKIIHNLSHTLLSLGEMMKANPRFYAHINGSDYLNLVEESFQLFESALNKAEIHESNFLKIIDALRAGVLLGSGTKRDYIAQLVRDNFEKNWPLLNEQQRLEYADRFKLYIDITTDEAERLKRAISVKLDADDDNPEFPKEMQKLLEESKPEFPKPGSKEDALMNALTAPLQSYGCIGAAFEKDTSCPQDVGATFLIDDQLIKIDYEFNGVKYHKDNDDPDDYFRKKRKQWTGEAHHVEPVNNKNQHDMHKLILGSLSQAKKAILEKSPKGSKWHEYLASEYPQPALMLDKKTTPKTSSVLKPPDKKMPFHELHELPKLSEVIPTPPKTPERKSTKPVVTFSEEDIYALAFSEDRENLDPLLDKGKPLNALTKEWDPQIIVNVLLKVMEKLHESDESESEKLLASAKILIKHARTDDLISPQVNAPLLEAIKNQHPGIIESIKIKFYAGKKSSSSRRKAKMWDKLIEAINKKIKELASTDRDKKTLKESKSEARESEASNSSMPKQLSALDFNGLEESKDKKLQTSMPEKSIDKPDSDRNLFVKRISRIFLDKENQEKLLSNYDLAVAGDVEAQVEVADIYYSGSEEKGVEPDYERAKKWFEIPAKEGNVDAQMRLAYMYRDGLGCDKNLPEAIRLLELAVGQNEFEALVDLASIYADENDLGRAIDYLRLAIEKEEETACCHLGRLYLERVIPSDVNAAVKSFRQGVLQGDAACQFELGKLYHHGQGVNEDVFEAIRLYKLAAFQECADAQAALGECYYYGIGVGEDHDTAVSYLELAAQKGNPKAQYLLGKYYEDELGDLNEAKQFYFMAAGGGYLDAQMSLAKLCMKLGDYEGAINAYKLAAEQGNTSAQMHLARFYAQGKVVTRDYTLAIRYNLMAANKGNAMAQNNLGTHYLDGLGVPKDAGKAVEWYKKASAQGQKDACYSLANCYLKANGVEYNPIEAFKNFKEAANKKHPLAWNDLGYCYERGLGTKKDLKKAKLAFQTSAQLGSLEAYINLGKLYKQQGDRHSLIEAAKQFQFAAEAGNEKAAVLLKELNEKGIIIPKNFLRTQAFLEKDKKVNSICKNYSLGHFSTGATKTSTVPTSTSASTSTKSTTQISSSEVADTPIGYRH